MKIFTALGLMSGTSMDGIDLAIVRSDGKNLVQRGPNNFVAYQNDTRQRLEEGLTLANSIENRLQRPGRLTDLENELTDLHYQAVRDFLVTNQIKPGEIDMIGFHGQTVLHNPAQALTIQLGDGQKLADQTGIEVIYDFRANDMEHGGQGAPLVPVYHAALSNGISAQFADENAVAFVNIGGISNITYVGRDDQLVAFDCGPGNCLIDQWIYKRIGMDFDEGGAIANEGEVVDEICSRYLMHPHFSQSIPKSLDRKDFEPLVDCDISTADGARSLARLTALTVIGSINQLPTLPFLIIVCGGGTLNPVIMDDLRVLAQQKGTRVITADDAALSSAAMEAEAFAYLAIRSKLGEPLTYPMTTGCNYPVPGGVSVLPSNAQTSTKMA
ncbi:MAG: anhydro-N-acetylmuramic acid kinase [Hyphomicrobiales bacterium]|nr:anhydro-N-acetylmuramic acid kinase [Hyphomicrobiales bacterium]